MFLDLVSDELNLRWAWDKVRNASLPGDIWIDEVALSRFELDLENNLRAIAKKLKSGNYHFSPLRPMAFPKSRDRDGNPRVRQYFHVSVADQVAWVSVVNIVGPHVDSTMASWNYGYRLHRNVWIDVDDEGRKKLRIGRYRNSSGHIYAPFRRGWPRFRRHVYLTVRAMAPETSALPNHYEDFEHEEDRQEFEHQQDLPRDLRCPYVFREYWSSAPAGEIYWCSIDLERFYPSLNLDTIRHNIVSCLPESDRIAADRLLSSMLTFPLDLEGWTDEDLLAVELTSGSSRFNHVPTGLFVAGFLANSALLRVDSEVSAAAEEAHIAHFRYVDDHIVLSRNFDALESWIASYQKLLDRHLTGASISPEKTEPELLGKYLSAKKSASAVNTVKEQEDAARKACRLDPDFPTPLMTKTLALVSAIARTDFELLDSTELAAIVDQLEHLLLAELPEEEIPTKTRLSFAASRLAVLAEHFLGTCDPVEGEEAAAEAISKGQADLAGTPVHRSSPTVSVSGSNRAAATSNRVFHLLRKVLRDRPDRTRLWTRAVLLCRETGVQGLRRIVSDIGDLRSSGQGLSAHYLFANTLSVVAASLVQAAEAVIDSDEPYWRRVSAANFLKDVAATHRHMGVSSDSPWYVRKSYQQYVFAMYCVERILRKPLASIADRLPREAVQQGADLLTSSDQETSAGLLWWVGRMTLGSLNSRAPEWLVEIAGNVVREDSAEFLGKFWRYFPYDVPESLLPRLSTFSALAEEDAVPWWVDALRYRPESNAFSQLGDGSAYVAASRILSADPSSTISLYEWASECGRLVQIDPSDPRVSEWTALEISRQVAGFFPDYMPLEQSALFSGTSSTARGRGIHPQNFRIPRTWVTAPIESWTEWGNRVKDTGVQIVAESDRIYDKRYEPLVDSAFRAEINPVRGLGLILYSLLRRTFEFPAAWNGPGQATVLRSLRALLLKDITCSTHTLGLLQSCLLARAAENLTIKREIFVSFLLDEDMTYDPYTILNPASFGRIASICQIELKRHQLSTLNNRARQLTPVSLQLLTKPNWASLFGNTGNSA